ncbi:DUF262 domain-containing protein [Nocardia farcinica]|uniref:DUF262 domain-containing protein n=1 Tax=Nocardia farcinica (strain IFM 10152) TaxID=247156 RepID=Q5YR97_NOCFA|nr:DUF262 domain-containing protein [Nocardia farcinica]BAD59294.1 hypothetical protein NFA_44430 [Nocardia farcinica IFM 10152]
MTKTLSAHEHPLCKVFSSDYEFTIPSYQRPYRWGTEQALQLLDDLEEALDHGSDEPYFLGSIVLVQRSSTEFDVIDGQQRLTTLSILFAVLRDLSSDKFAEALGEMVMDPGNELRGIESKPRLTVRQQDRRFFTKHVQEACNISTLIGLSDQTVKSEPQRAMRDNAAALHERLESWTEARRRSLATLMSNRTFLVIVSTPDLGSAYRIFSVMNARGLDLDPTDIFKSTVIGAVGEHSGYAEQWEDVEQSLGRDDFTELFQDIRTIVNGKRAQRELLKEFPEQVLNPYIENGRAAAFVDELLLPYSSAFERTRARDFGLGNEWQPVNDWLKRLATLDNKDWRPPALWAIKNHGDDPAFLTDFLRKLERLAADSLLRGEYTTPRVLRYLRLLSDLRGGAGLDAPSFQLSDEEKRLARETLDGEIYRKTERARYVLLRLDEILANNPGATYSHSIISIEHVLPQNPKQGSHWMRDFTPEEREYWTHRLGNLLLLNRRKNSQVRNYDFAAKKSKYFTTSTGSAVFALTTQVLGYDEWTPAIVEKRQRELTDLLVREWELN